LYHLVYIICSHHIECEIERPDCSFVVESRRELLTEVGFGACMVACHFN